MDVPHLFSAFIFAGRRFVEGNARASIALFASAVFVTGTSAWYVAALHRLHAVRTELLVLESANKAQPAAAPSDNRRVLAAFKSSHLITILNASAASADVHAGEIMLVLEDTPNQPFLRYRATLSLMLDYPRLRKFVAETLAASNDITLDAISCARGELKTAELRCDFTFAEAYRKADNG